MDAKTARQQALSIEAERAATAYAPRPRLSPGEAGVRYGLGAGAAGTFTLTLAGFYTGEWAAIVVGIAVGAGMWWDAKAQENRHREACAHELAKLQNGE